MRDLHFEVLSFVAIELASLWACNMGCVQNLWMRSIVAAGSVVLGLQIPPDSLVKGNPAQIVPR